MVSDRSTDSNEIRSMFERASKHVGDDFAAHQLWDKFLEFEVSMRRCYSNCYCG